MPTGWRLSTRLSVLVVALFAMLLLLVVASYLRASTERRNAEFDNSVFIARNAAAAVDAFTKDIEATSVSAAIPLGRAGALNQDVSGEYLREITVAYGVLRTIFATDLAGRVVATSATGVGVDISSRAYIKALQAGAEKIWSGSLAGLETGEVTVAYGRVIRAPAGEPIGFLLFAFYPDRLVPSLGITLPPDSELTLVDGSGLVLFDSHRPVLPGAERDLSGLPEVARATSGELVALTGAAVPFAGDQRYGAIVPIENVGWALAFTRPLGPLDAALQERFVYEAGALVAVVVAFALLAAVVANRLTRPLTQMAAAAAAIARGERPGMPAADSGDTPEVRQLASAMRVMTQAVAEREDRLDFLARSGEELARSLDYSTTLKAVTQLAVPAIADWCVIDLVEGRRLARLEVAFADERDQGIAEDLRRSLPVDDTERNPSWRAIRSGAAVLVPAVTAEMLRAGMGEGAEFSLYRKLSPVSYMIVPLRARGQVLGALSFISSRSGRSFGDGELALAEEVARRAALAIDNARLYREVQEAVRTRDEFLSAAAHDLKTPLTAIRGFAQIMQRRSVTPTDGESLTRIVDAATRMSLTIDELMDLTRLRLGDSLEMHVVPMDLTHVVENVVRDYTITAPAHRIRVNAPSGAINGAWDRARIERMVGNLLSNAIKFSPAGGEIVVTATVEGGDAIVSVRDSGIGIREEEAERIFDRFARGSNVGRIGGTGIGLTLVREVAEHHGGAVVVQSRPGAGSTFLVRLPLSRPD